MAVAWHALSIIIIIMWLVLQTLPFPRAPSLHFYLCSMIDSCQTNVKWSNIKFYYVEPSLTRSAWSAVRPLVRGPHWTSALSCGPWMDQHMRCGQRTWDEWYRWRIREWWLFGSSADLHLKCRLSRKFIVCDADTTDQMRRCFSIVVECFCSMENDRKDEDSA